MENIVAILSITPVTHDVKCFRLQKPEGYNFEPGHATDVSINKPELKNETRPFTFTALQDAPYLEFTIKRYPDRHGITDKLHQLRVGDELIIRDTWGTIDYKGPGYFIAGGAGVTPFIAILRSLHRQNKIAGNTLFFSNKTAADIIYEEELKSMLGENALFILSKENRAGYLNGHIDGQFLKQHILDLKKHCYVCGPDQMVADLVKNLKDLGADTETVVFEAP